MHNWFKKTSLFSSSAIYPIPMKAEAKLSKHRKAREKTIGKQHGDNQSEDTSPRGRKREKKEETGRKKE